MSVISTVLDYVFSPYGWFVTFGVILAYTVYHKAILPKIEQVQKEKEFERRKKFDEDVDAKVAEKVLETRQRQQAEHDRVAEELKRQKEEKERERLEEMRKKEEGESVLKNAVGSHEVKKLLPKEAKMTPREIIDKYISSKPVVIFSKSWCPFCRKAKAALATFRLSPSQYEIIELDERTDLPGDAIQDELQKMVGSRSVPKVFISGECIGGGDDTVRLQKEGILDQLIASALQ